MREVASRESCVGVFALAEKEGGRGSILNSGNITIRTEERVSTPGTVDEMFS